MRKCLVIVLHGLILVAMKIAFQMEPIEEAKRDFSNSLLLIQEAGRRGYEVFHYVPEKLTLLHDKVVAQAAPVHVDLSQEQYYELGPYEELDLTRCDIVFMRQEPSPNINYITATYMLDVLRSYGVFVTNVPSGIRNTPEKLSVFDFPDYLPPTIVSRDAEAVKSFFVQHGDLIAKPLYSFYGHGIARLTSEEQVEDYLRGTDEYFLFQKFLPEVAEGNKRIVLFDGEVVCAKNSIPPQGSFNTHDGYTDVAFELSDYEREMCKKVGKVMKERGLHYVGLDVIGKYITEINVTCPGSLREMYHMEGSMDSKYEAKIFDIIEAKVKALAVV